MTIGKTPNATIEECRPMGPNDHDLKAVFGEALDRPAGTEREAYLDQAAPAGTPLRARVDALLQADAEAGRFLASNPANAPATDPDSATGADVTRDRDPDVTAELDPGRESARPTAGRTITEGPGTVIGPYKLLQQIGEGGMGTVYMAEQEKPIRRRVALKIIKPGMDSAQVIARFEAERQALALMDHPNIARVLDAGQTDSGRPFFVMELVNGVPITQYCDEARLSPRARLELFAQVCQAVQHAHQKGIIHRDIKPSNVLVTMVDGRPTQKVIDFGVAKAVEQRLTERTMFTQFGAIVGTLEYMSPEQAELGSHDVDTRSDIYALGVLLYELLTGTTPLDRASLRQAGYAEILRRIQEEEPPKPSTRLSDSGDRLPSIAAVRDVEPARLPGLVRGELDWIVMKALEKDRTRRYETASGLARDIGRYLDGDPVEACPPSRSYRLRKFARKHRAALATASAFMTLVALAAVVSVAMAARAIRAERLASGRLAAVVEAEGQVREALGRSEEAREQAEAVSAFLVDTFRSPDPRLEGKDLRVVDVLDRAVEKLRSEGPAPATRATLLHAIGLTYEALGAGEKAIDALREAWETRSQLLGVDHIDTLLFASDYGRSLMFGRRQADAKDLFEKTLQGMRSQVPPEDPRLLKVLDRVAWSYQEVGKAEESIRILEDLVPRLAAARGDLDVETLFCRDNLARAYWSAGRRDDAIRTFEDSLAAWRKAKGPRFPDTLETARQLAGYYSTVGRHPEALPLLEQVVAGRRARLGPQHRDTLSAVRQLANLYQSLKRNDEAIRELAETLGPLMGSADPVTVSALSGMSSLAQLYFLARNAREATRWEDELARRLTSWKGPADATLGELAHALGHRVEARDAAAAEALFQQALDHYRRAQGPGGPLTLDLTRDLAMLFDRAGRPAEAEPLLRGLLAATPADHPARADSLAPLGLNLLTRRKWAEAEPVLRECLQLRAKAIPDDWRTFNTRSMLGAALLGQEKHAEAEPLLLEGHEGLKARADKIPPPFQALRLREAAGRIVSLYEAWGKPDEAAEWREKLKDDLPPPPADAPP